MKAHHLGIAASAMLGILCGYSLKSSHSKSRNETAGDSVDDHVHVVPPHQAFLQESDMQLGKGLQDSEELHGECSGEPRADTDNAMSNDLAVRLWSYRREVENSIFSRSTEYGYKFQVFLNGIPFGMSQEVPVKVLGKDADVEEKIDAIEVVIEVIAALKRLHPAIVWCDCDPVVTI